METNSDWNPDSLEEVDRVLGTSTKPARVRTNKGWAILKVLGNPEGPHGLACDLVGTKLAKLFGLRTAESAILTLGSLDVKLLDSKKQFGFQTGPAFASKVLEANPWGGTSGELEAIANPEHIARLVVFDTWTCNYDRHPPKGKAWKVKPDNILLSGNEAPQGKFFLVPIDHAKCFMVKGAELGKGFTHLECIKDERIFGLFKEFRCYLSGRYASALSGSVKALGTIKREDVESCVSLIPPEWEVSPDVRAGLVSFLLSRAKFLQKKLLAICRAEGLALQQAELQPAEGEQPK